MKKEPIDPTYDTPSDMSAHTLIFSTSVAPNIPPKVFYGPHPLKPMFSKLDLFSMLNKHQKSKSLSTRLSILITIPDHTSPQQEHVLPLPSSQPTDIPNPVSEESHTIEPIEAQLELPPEPNTELSSAEPITESTLLETTTLLPDITLEPLDLKLNMKQDN